MAIAFLTLALLATVQGESTAQCALDGAGAIDPVADAAVFIWSATKRCDKSAKTGNAVKCEVDIASAAQAVGNMADTIVGAAEECGAIDTKNSECGRSVGQFLSGTSGLAAAVGGVLDSCPNQLQPKGTAAADILDSDTALGKCVIDVKSSLTSVFQIMNGLSNMKGETAEAGAPAVFTDFGSYVAGSVNACTAYKGSGNGAAACASASLGLISALDRVGTLGEELSTTCAKSGSRLYLLDKPIGNAGMSSPANLALAAFLPITAVLSFVVGMRFAKARAKKQGELVEVRELE